jgi:hypothetical protein
MSELIGLMGRTVLPVLSVRAGQPARRGQEDPAGPRKIFENVRCPPKCVV